MPAQLRRFAAGDGCDAVDLAGRLLAGALEYLRFALETIEDEEGRMGGYTTVTVKLDGEQMDVLLGDIRELHERIDALERRIERIDGMLDGKPEMAEDMTVRKLVDRR